MTPGWSRHIHIGPQYRLTRKGAQYIERRYIAPPPKPEPLEFTRRQVVLGVLVVVLFLLAGMVEGLPVATLGVR